jgi:hypothetical protein
MISLMTRNSLLRRWSRYRESSRRNTESYWQPRNLGWLEDRDAMRGHADLLAARDRSSWT